MSIEGSRHIDPFIKAKLQESGIVGEDQLRRILKSVWTASSGGEKDRIRRSMKALQSSIPSLADNEARALLSIDWRCGGKCSSSPTTSSPSVSIGTSFDSLLSPDPTSPSPIFEGYQDEVLNGIPFQIRTLAQLKKEKRERRKRGGDIRASTFCRSLDQLLGGGGAGLGEVLEISGPPGVGKTQLLMQLAVSCTLPVMLGGLGGSCLYIDTEGSFVPERFYQIVSAAVSIVNKVSPFNVAPPNDSVKESEWINTNGSITSSRKIGTLNHEKKKRERSGSCESGPQLGASSYHGNLSNFSLSHYTPEYVMKRVHYCRVVSPTRLLAILHCLPDIVSQKTNDGKEKKADHIVSKDDNLKMVLVDSVAMPFRSLESFSETRVKERNSTGDCWYDSILSRSAEDQRRAASSRRTRLIFMMSQLLYSHATELSLAVVVSNHVVSRPLKGSLSLLERTRKSTQDHDVRPFHQEPDRSILLPALGDSWGFGLSSRVVLSYHHHYLPFNALPGGKDTGSANESSFECFEDNSCSKSRRDTDKQSAETGSSVVSSIRPQHRVARIVKGTPDCCQEVCFAITGKGIRGWRSQEKKG